jgi:hypothetical protein
MRSKRATLTAKSLLNEVVTFYASSNDANGLPVQRVVNTYKTDSAMVQQLARKLVADGLVEVVFAEVDENPHIRRLPRLWRKPFQELIETCNFDEASHDRIP